MSEAKYTKGKWKWWTSNSWKRLMSEHDGQTTSVIVPYVCRDGHPDLEISNANMPLIEAAPDLYEACREARQLLANKREGTSLQPGWLELQLADAIKKATP